MLNPELGLNQKALHKNVKKITTRAGYGEGILELGSSNKNIVVLTADLTESTYCHDFAQNFPERFVQVGVAEQNMIGIAAGLALSGKIPFAASYAVFNPGKNWDQIRISVCYSQANVKIIGTHAGLSVGPDGASHQALEDIALMRVLPNMTVLSPVDYEEAKKATKEAAKLQGPVYIRLARDKTPTLTTDKTPFEIGKMQTWLEGKDVTIIATGPILHEALLAAKEMKEKHKISAEVLNCTTIKPLDKEAIIKSAKKTKKVITLEEHQINGGLGSAVAEILAENYPTKMIRMGIQDAFGKSGTYEELKKEYKLTAKDIIKETKKLK